MNRTLTKCSVSDVSVVNSPVFAESCCVVEKKLLDSVECFFRETETCLGSCSAVAQTNISFDFREMETLLLPCGSTSQWQFAKREWRKNCWGLLYNFVTMHFTADPRGFSNSVLSISRSIFSINKGHLFTHLEIHSYISQSCVMVPV